MGRRERKDSVGLSGLRASCDDAVEVAAVAAAEEEADGDGDGDHALTAATVASPVTGDSGREETMAKEVGGEGLTWRRRMLVVAK